MMGTERLSSILNYLSKGDLSVMTLDNIQMVANEALRLIGKENCTWDIYDLSCADLIILMSQTVYDNTDLDVLFLDDGIYDKLINAVRIIKGTYQVGSPAIIFNDVDTVTSIPMQELDISDKRELIEPVQFIGDDTLGMNYEEQSDKYIFLNELIGHIKVDSKFCNPNLLAIDDNAAPVNKKYTSVKHIYPELSGTLDKCTITLNSEATELGLLNDDKTVIFERDFIGRHLNMGIINPNCIELVLELKYDGVAIEAEVTDRILSARSRGDTTTGDGADLTPIFKDYVFPYAPKLSEADKFGIQFEAIITKYNLNSLSKLTGRTYANARNAIIGILGSNDAYKYRDFITLVPLKTSLDVDLVDEIEFMNRYYNSGECMRYAVVSGDYNYALFQVYRFVKEALDMRPVIPFMYDGIVVHYRDRDIINKLGRKNSVNLYSMAIKFQSIVKTTIFTGYSYTVGLSGKITPMANFIPVEFFGQIHPKCSMHSYAKTLNYKLAIGDHIKIFYSHDVMPQISEDGILRNPNATPDEFITHCPVCKSELTVRIKDGKPTEKYCDNVYCTGRQTAVGEEMLRRLGIKGFGPELVGRMEISCITDLLTVTMNRDLLVSRIGIAAADRLLNEVGKFMTQPIKDYKLMTALCIPGVADKSWKSILCATPFDRIINTGVPNYVEILSSAVYNAGLGGGANAIRSNNIIAAILSYNDLHPIDFAMLRHMDNIVVTYLDCPTTIKKQICFTGVRDQPLADMLIRAGYPVSDGYFTNSTDVLVIRDGQYRSSKLDKALAINEKRDQDKKIIIVPYLDFKRNLAEILDDESFL